MTLSKKQLESKEKYLRWFWIHERDLLWMAQRYEPWRLLAFNLGFSAEKIEQPWTFTDEGRLIRYAEIKGS